MGVVRHLGHTLDVHQIHYRHNCSELDSKQVARIFLLLDAMVVGQLLNK